LTGGTRASRRGGSDEKGTRPLSPCMEGPMAGRAPFTDLLVASYDPLGLSPEDDRRPPASKTLSVSPLEGEDLFPEVGRTPGPCVFPLPGEAKRGLPPSQERTCFRRVGETRSSASLPSQGRTRGVLPNHKTKRGLATPGYCDSPIGGPILVVRENIVLRPRFGRSKRGHPTTRAGKTSVRHASPGRSGRPAVGRYG